MPVKKKISFKISRTWSFNKSVSKVFDAHVIESIPLYKRFNNQIAKISEFYLKDNAVIYDIGCSTGNYISEICKIKKNNLKIVGIDQNKDMINIAQKKIRKFKKKNDIKLICKNVFKLKFEKFDLAICSLLLPFFAHGLQIKLVKKIYRNLNNNGAAIFLNKCISETPRFENIYNQLYYDFKQEQGVSPSDILKKTKSLRSVHSVNTSSQDIKLFKKIGFKKVEIFFKFLNFTGYLVEK